MAHGEIIAISMGFLSTIVRKNHFTQNLSRSKSLLGVVLRFCIPNLFIWLKSIPHLTVVVKLVIFIKLFVISLILYILFSEQWGNCNLFLNLRIAASFGVRMKEEDVIGEISFRLQFVLCSIFNICYRCHIWKNGKQNPQVLTVIIVSTSTCLGS